MKRDLNGTGDSASDFSSRKKQKREDIVSSINDLSHEKFHDSFVEPSTLIFEATGDIDSLFDITHKSCSVMTEDDLKDCFDLIEQTSVHEYRNSTIGWKPENKRREMADQDMHYLLVTPVLKHRITYNSEPNTRGEKMLAGFMSFMITYDSTPSVPVLYIYEVHLAEANRKCGLGKYLMDLASDVASRAGMTKSMLTCFVSNTRARRFYERYGFQLDPCSPGDRRTRGKVIKTDHIIMSKLV